MDKIEPRIHDEIKDYKEKFYNFTLRQWLFAIIMLITVIPLYLFLSPIIGTDLAGWLVIIVAIPIGFFGFIPIQGLNAEKMVFFWKRNYINFAKPIFYQPQEDAQKKTKVKQAKSKLPKEEKQEKRRNKKNERNNQRAIKRERQKQRELARARQKFGIVSQQSNNSYSLSEEEMKVLLEFVQKTIRKEQKQSEEEPPKSST